jgi:hypothetical protein
MVTGNISFFTFGGGLSFFQQKTSLLAGFIFKIGGGGPYLTLSTSLSRDKIYKQYSKGISLR